MKLNSFIKLIAGLFIISDQTLAQSEQRNNYNILIPKEQDLKDIIKILPKSLAYQNLELQNIAKKFTTVALTETEAKDIAKILQSYKGILEPDYVYNSENNLANNAEPISSISNCNVPIYEEDVVIIGTKIYDTQPALKNYTVKIIYDPFKLAPCNAHETIVAEAITKVINGGDIKFLNAVSSDCYGQSFVSNIGAATDAAIKYKKTTSKGRRMTINVSSTGRKSMIVDSIFTNAIKANIRVVIAAGNFAKDAQYFSPANLGCSIAETIGSTEDKRPAFFTNYGECVDIFVPGCMMVFNPQTQRPYYACGTSYSAPIQAARGMIERFYFPQYTIKQIKFRLQDRTINITVPAGANFNGFMRVLNTELECPKNTNPKIFTGIVPFNKWLALAPPNLCVQFTASRASGAVLIKFIDSKAETCTVTLSAKPKNTKEFMHSIQCSNKTLATSYSKDAMVSAKQRQFTLMQKNNSLLISYKDKNREQIIINSTAIGSQQAIAFDKTGRATIKNALHC